MNEIERSLSRIDSDLLRTFLAVADCRNLTNASDGLGRTQSAISVQIKKLEEALGVSLFERRARGMQLTGNGDALVPAARSVVESIDRISDMFRAPLEGKVRVGFPDEMGHGFLQSMLARFSAQHPGVEIEMRCGNSTAFPDMMRRDELDLALYTCSPKNRVGSVVRTEKCVWAAAKSWKPTEGQPIPLALYDRACWWRDVALEAMQLSDKPYRIAVTSESTAGVVAAIRAGLAVGMLERGLMTNDMRVLGSRDGFAKLPNSTLTLLAGQNADKNVVEAMTGAIKNGLSHETAT